MLTGVGLVIHEFAEGIITYSVLLKGGISGKKAGVYAFLVAALTTPIGAFIVYPPVSYTHLDVYKRQEEEDLNTFLQGQDMKELFGGIERRELLSCLLGR